MRDSCNDNSNPLLKWVSLQTWKSEMSMGGVINRRDEPNGVASKVNSYLEFFLVANCKFTTAKQTTPCHLVSSIEVGIIK
jgi:hypothetical protein